MHQFPTVDTDLAHDGDGALLNRCGHLVLDQVEHVLVVEQADQVERAEAGRAAQRQVANHHRTDKANNNQHHKKFSEPIE